MRAHMIDLWVRSGNAAATARELALCVLIVFCLVAYLAWKDSK